MVIEIIGALFGALMLYLTYATWRRGQLSGADMGLWGIVWVALVGFAVFAAPLQSSAGALGLVRLLDLLTIAAFAVLLATGFFLFKKVRVLEQKMETLVENAARAKKR